MTRAGFLAAIAGLFVVRKANPTPEPNGWLYATARWEPLPSHTMERRIRRGPDIVLKIDGIDPNNPRHQALIARARGDYGRR